MRQHIQLKQMLFDQPLMVEPSYLKIMLGAVNDRLHIDKLSDADGSLGADAIEALAADYRGRNRMKQDGVYKVSNGVAIIPVDGSLVHKNGRMQPYSGMTGYDGIQACIEEALSDGAVRGILLDVDSPGGQVAGAFACADFIAEANKVKPIWGHANELAASAAYAVISQCEQVHAYKTSRVGSIGVVMAHWDHSKMLEEHGAVVTLIHAGAHKVDGNPYEKLPESVRGAFQAEAESTRQLFADVVAAGRGMSTQSVLDTEAKVYSAAQALEVGLIDSVQSFDQTLEQFINHLSGQGSVNIGAHAMSDTPAADMSAEQTAAIDTARQEATASERTRIAGILSCDEATGREATAQHLALNTDNSVEDAQALLATMPQASESTAAVPKGMLKAAMKGADQPDVGADAQEVVQQNASLDAQSIYKNRKGA